MSNTKKQATFKVIHFTKINRYVAVAHAYEHAVLMSTTGRETYTEARAELDELAAGRGVELRWFDGEFECSDGEQIFPKAG